MGYLYFTRWLAFVVETNFATHGVARITSILAYAPKYRHAYFFILSIDQPYELLQHEPSPIDFEMRAPSFSRR